MTAHILFPVDSSTSPSPSTNQCALGASGSTRSASGIPPAPPAAPLPSTQRAALLGLVTNVLLAGIKLLAGLVGHSYALIADAIESLTDVVGSVIIWGGLKYSAKPADDNHPYGHGKAESLAAMLVSLMVGLAGIVIAVESVREILTPHHAPASFTLIVLVVVVAVKETLFRVVSKVGKETGSGAVEVDAWHHRSDAITSAAAFIGISIALIGGKGWEPADDYAALVASAVILYNSWRLMRVPLRELMDEDAPNVAGAAREVALEIPGVLGVEKNRARKSGNRYHLEMHIEVAPDMPVRDAHCVGGKVRATIRARLRAVADVIVHIEPFESHGNSENAPPPTAPPTAPGQ